MSKIKNIATIRHQVIKTALKKWEKMQEDEDAGVRPVFRPREWKEKERRLDKERKKEKWHQAHQGQVSAPLIIDPTAGNLAGEFKDVCKSFEEVTRKGWKCSQTPCQSRAAENTRLQKR